MKTEIDNFYTDTSNDLKFAICLGSLFYLEEVKRLKEFEVEKKIKDEKEIIIEQFDFGEYDDQLYKRKRLRNYNECRQRVVECGCNERTIRYHSNVDKPCSAGY
jgi:hypothetical protein